MTDVPVSQEAREAAAEYLPLADEECGECERGLMRCGEMDDHWLVQAFARHRQQAERDVIARMEAVAWMYGRGEARHVVRERVPNLPAFTEVGWTEHALGIIPTPPAGEA